MGRWHTAGVTEGHLARSTNKNTVHKAKRLRREMSLPEVMLWQILRAKPLGIKFRRQHPVGPYVLDFYCAAARLAIEIDGISHAMGDRPARDERRDRVLGQRAIETIRIPAQDVLDDVNAVADRVVRYVQTKL